jgi:hypothetical protein
MSETVRETQHEGQEGARTDSAARILSQGTAGAHVAGPLESKPGMAGLLLWRQGCRCGYRAMWERTPGQAIESNARHFNRATR